MNLKPRCLVYFNINNTKNTQKGQAKLCSTAYIKDKCRCINCKEFAYIKQNNYRKNNLEKIRKYHREYSKKNPIKIKEYSDKNKKRIAKDIDKYKQKRKEYNDRYKSANPEKIKELWRNKDRKRRATIRKNGYERYTELDVLKTYGSVCYLCMCVFFMCLCLHVCMYVCSFRYCTFVCLFICSVCKRMLLCMPFFFYVFCLGVSHRSGWVMPLPGFSSNCCRYGASLSPCVFMHVDSFHIYLHQFSDIWSGPQVI
jgi:hypothetical protein